MLRSCGYSATHAGNIVLKQSVEMRFGLISKAKMNFHDNLVKRIEEISRINMLSFSELQREYSISFNGGN